MQARSENDERYLDTAIASGEGECGAVRVEGGEECGRHGASDWKARAMAMVVRLALE